MNYRFKLTVLIIFICIMLIGCSYRKEEGVLDSLLKDDLIESEFNEPIDENDMGAFMFGPKLNGENKTFIYTGKEVHIPFEVLGLSNTVSDFGLFLFIDGDAQPFRIIREDDTYIDESIMHKFSLSNNQVENFDIVFSPIRGNKGDKVGIEFATIFKPDFMPEDKEKSNYYNYHSLSATTPQELYFEVGITDNIVKSGIESKEEDIPDSIIKENTRSNSVVSKLDNKVVTQLLPNEKETDFNNNVFISENNKVKFRLRIMGGPNDINYRTYIYINHKPVKVMGYDCFDANIKKGKMRTFELELDITEYDNLYTIYAISNPIGDAYMSSYNFAVKTISGLVVTDNPIKSQTNVTDKNEKNLKINNSIKTIRVNLTDFTFGIYDWYKNEITISLKYPNNEIINNYFTLKNGYATFNYVSNLPIEINVLNNGDKKIKTPKTFIEKTIKLYDTELNLLKEVNIGRFIPNIDLIDLFTIDVSSDGKKIAWAYEQNLYVYDINSDNLIKIFENSNPASINFLKIKLTEEGDDIIYYGYIPKDKNVLTNYGIIDIKNNNMINFTHDAKFKARDIRLTTNYVCIIDEEDGMPPTTSGTVLVIDLKNKKTYDIKVDSFESKMSVISYNEEYLISAIKSNDDYVRVRQYSLDSELIKEQSYKTGDKKFYPTNIVVEKGNKAYILLNNNTDIQKYIEFTCEEK